MLSLLRSLYKYMMNVMNENMDSGGPLSPKSYKNSWSVATLTMGSLVYAATIALMSIFWLLTHSFHAKLLAVKRVTSNKGRKTPGIDGILWKGNKAKMQAALSLKRHGYNPQPLRRIYIPKKNGKKRPLSIPTVFSYYTSCSMVSEFLIFPLIF